jgi:hypothetical protein
MMRLFLICSSAVLLSACGELDQSQSAERHLPDTPAWKGANNAYVAKGWTPGDKTAWEKQIRARGQSQNEYVKTN